MSLCGALSSPICLCSHPVLTNNRDSPDCLMKSTCVGVAALPQNVYLLSWQTALTMFFCAKGMVPALPPQLKMKAHLKSSPVKYKGVGSWITACPVQLGQWSTAPLHLFSTHIHVNQTKTLCGGSGIIRWLSSMCWTPDKISPK